MALEVLWFILALLGSFLSGSIPYSVLIGRLSTGKDLRNYNIGNPGGFNAVLTYGIPIGMTILFTDVLKGFIPIALIDWSFSKYIGIDTIWYQLAVILGPALCILGHNHSPFLKFRGGRGAAVFAGTFFWVNPLVFIISFLPFGLMIGFLKVPARVSMILAAIFYLPAALFVPIAPPYSMHMLETLAFPQANPFLYLVPFLIALGMLLAQLPRLIPSVIAAIRGEEWTYKISEGQQLPEKFDTEKEFVGKEEEK